MADLNVTYHPFTHEYDLRAIKNELLYEFFEEGSEIRQNMDNMLIIPLTKFNEQQYAFANAVKVAYSGSTSDDRKAWLTARIEAVYDRMDFIRSDVEGNKEQIINAGGAPPADVMATIASVLTVIPVTRPVGAFATVAAKLVNRSNDNAAYRQEKIQQATAVLNGYATDLQQLSLIQKQLYSELIAVPNTPDKTDPTLLEKFYQSAKAIPKGWYIAGGVLILLILFWLKRRNSARR